MTGWHFHPRVRSGGELTIGERAADRMRNSMGSWPFVFAALAYLGVWILIAETHLAPIDNPQLTILNLVLSCIAALQGAILLIAAKRSDQVSSELAQHDYEADVASRELLTTLTAEFAAMKRQHAELTAQHAEQTRQLAAILRRLPNPGMAARGAM